jgi:hypothetical protein
LLRVLALRAVVVIIRDFFFATWACFAITASVAARNPVLAAVFDDAGGAHVDEWR